MKRLIIIFSFSLFYLFGGNAQAEMSKEEAISFCTNYVNKKMPQACPTVKQPAYCNSLGIRIGTTFSYFYPYYAEAIRNNTCLAQKQITFNVCFNGNYNNPVRNFFSKWEQFKVADMKCGLCHPSYPKTGWCY